MDIDFATAAGNAVSAIHRANDEVACLIDKEPGAARRSRKRSRRTTVRERRFEWIRAAADSGRPFQASTPGGDIGISVGATIGDASHGGQQRHTIVSRVQSRHFN